MKNGLELKLEAGLIDKNTQPITPMGHPITEGEGCKQKADIQSRTKNKITLLNNCFSIFNGMNFGSK